MKQCKKVKNPCKICFQTVSPRNGIQCQGACQTWIHYNCLNYTPGRISDIKSGVIQITCPCPDCKSTHPKEYRIDEPYSCTNTQCPANNAPICTNTGCPSNTETNKQNQTSGMNMSNPLPVCAKELCKENKGPGPPNAVNVEQNCPSMSQYPSLEQSGDGRSANATFNVVEQMCNTVGQLTEQIKELMDKMKEVVKEKGQGSALKSSNKVCTQTGSKALCPKPCNCPDNPGVNRK